jgi:hypothetical protein
MLYHTNALQSQCFTTPMLYLMVPYTYNALPHQCFTIQGSHTEKKSILANSLTQE